MKGNNGFKQERSVWYFTLNSIQENVYSKNLLRCLLDSLTIRENKNVRIFPAFLHSRSRTDSNVVYVRLEHWRILYLWHRRPVSLPIHDQPHHQYLLSVSCPCIKCHNPTVKALSSSQSSLYYGEIQNILDRQICS